MVDLLLLLTLDNLKDYREIIINNVFGRIKIYKVGRTCVATYNNTNFSGTLTSSEKNFSNVIPEEFRPNSFTEAVTITETGTGKKFRHILTLSGDIKVSALTSGVTISSSDFTGAFEQTSVTYFCDK